MSIKSNKTHSRRRFSTIPHILWKHTALKNRRVQYWICMNLYYIKYYTRFVIISFIFREKIVVHFTRVNFGPFVNVNLFFFQISESRIRKYSNQSPASQLDWTRVRKKSFHYRHRLLIADTDMYSKVFDESHDTIPGFSDTIIYLNH